MFCLQEAQSGGLQCDWHGSLERGEWRAEGLSLCRALQGVIGPGMWATAYQTRYGSVPDFLRTHPEAFYQRKADGAFYRPDAPARLPPQQPPPKAAPAVATAAITPAAPHARGMAMPASGALCALLQLYSHVLHSARSSMQALFFPCLLLLTFHATLEKNTGPTLQPWSCCRRRCSAFAAQGSDGSAAPEPAAGDASGAPKTAQQGCRGAL